MLNDEIEINKFKKTQKKINLRYVLKLATLIMNPRLTLLKANYKRTQNSKKR